MEYQYEAEFKPVLKDKYDVSNFDTAFTSEEAVNSVIPNSKLEMIKKFDEEFKEF